MPPGENATAKFDQTAFVESPITAQFLRSIFGIEQDRPVQRLIELAEQRNELLKHIQAHDIDALDDLHPSIRTAVQEFYSFFVGYNHYFWNLGVREIQGQTYESILYTVLENTRSLWEQLSQAINQRFNPVYMSKLQQADAKALEMLDRVRGVVRGQPILYFDKSYRISRHPYQTYPLLGISQERVDLDGDASLAHELGHHVFWNNGELQEYSDRLDMINEEIAARVFSQDFPTVEFANPAKAQETIQATFDQFGIWRGWIEEVFADVFGTLITGPKFVKCSQDVLVRERVKVASELITDDGQHPVPALRPFISLEALRMIAKLQDDDFGAQLKALIEQLEERWTPIWEDALREEEGDSQEPPSIIHLGHVHDDDQPPVTLQQLRDSIPQMVDLVLHKLKLESELDGRQQSSSLLDSVLYWGKERTEEEVKEIEGLLESARNDRLTTVLASSSVEKALREAPPLETKYQLFAKFLTFIREHQKKAQTNRLVAGSQEWMTILDFDLNLDQGAHGYCSNHDGTGCHKHRANGRRVSC